MGLRDRGNPPLSNRGASPYFAPIMAISVQHEASAHRPIIESPATVARTLLDLLPRPVVPERTKL